MANLKHVVSELHQVYLAEMDAKIKPQLGGSSASSSGSEGGEKSAPSGGGEDNIKKAARQLAYDTRYKARREGIPLERAFTQALQNSSASAPVKDAAKGMLFTGDKKEEVELESNSIQELRKGDKEQVRVTPKKGFGQSYVRFADGKKKHELRSNNQIQSVTPTDHGEPYEGGGDKGKKTKKNDDNLANNYPPYDKVTRGDVIAGAKGKDQMGGKKKLKKSSDPKESFSNWKADLGLDEETVLEVVGKDKEVKIKENDKVNNIITINPELKEGIGKLGGKVLGIEEVDEAVYGGTPEGLTDTRMTVTNADKKGNTKAYRNYLKGLKNKQGQPVYKSADHMKESDSVKKISAEAVDTTSTLSAKQQDTERIQAQNARNQIALDKTSTINKQKKDAADRAELKREIKQEVGEETELAERTRFAKEKGTDPQTGKPSEKGGKEPSKAFKSVQSMIRSSGGALSSRGNAVPIRGKKKVKGDKPKFNQPQSPAQKIKADLARKRAPKPEIGSRFD